MFKRALLALLEWTCRKELIERSVIDDHTGSVYLTRYILRKSDRGNIYIHRFHRSDSDDLHDHSWDFTTFILAGGYSEVTPWGKTKLTRWHGPRSIIKHRATDRHQVKLKDGREAWTLVFTGRKRRDWGFWLESGLFVPWKKYMDMKFGENNWRPA